MLQPCFFSQLIAPTVQLLLHVKVENTKTHGIFFSSPFCHGLWKNPWTLSKKNGEFPRNKAGSKAWWWHWRKFMLKHERAMFSTKKTGWEMPWNAKYLHPSLLIIDTKSVEILWHTAGITNSSPFAYSLVKYITTPTPQQALARLLCKEACKNKLLGKQELRIKVFWCWITAKAPTLWE